MCKPWLGWELKQEVAVFSCFDLAGQLGLQVSGLITAQDALTFRQRTPIAKFFTAKSVVATISEGLEYFGRQGYKKIQDYQGPGLSGNI